MATAGRRRTIWLPHLGLRGRAWLYLVIAAATQCVVMLLSVLSWQQATAIAAQRDATAQAQVQVVQYGIASDAELADLNAYTLNRSRDSLAGYRHEQAVALADLRELGRGPLSQSDLAPLRHASAAWQAFMTKAAATPSAELAPDSLAAGAPLFGSVQRQEQRLDALLQQLQVQESTRFVIAVLSRAVFTVIDCAVGLIALVLLARLVFVGLMGPLRQLSRVARAIADGEGPRIPALDRRDELGQLAMALDDWNVDSQLRLDLAHAIAMQKDRDAKRLEALNQSSKALAGVLEIPRMAEVLVAQAEALLRRGSVAVLWYEPSTDRYTVLAQSAALHLDGSLPASAIADQVLRSDGPFRIPARADAPRATPLPGIPDGARGVVSVPLRSGTRPVGALVGFPPHDGALDAADLQLMTVLAAQVSPNLEAARLHSEVVEAHEELLVANEELAQASRHKSEFLAAMSHELRTPLNAVLGFSELLLDGHRAIDPARRQAYLEHIHSGGQQLLNQITQLLDMAKVEAGKMEVHKARFDLIAEIEHVLASLRPLAGKAGVILESSGPVCLTIDGDQDMIRRILLNLLSNAIKFTPSGGHVGVIVEEEPGQVRLAVRDDGVGIPASEHERIFEEFHQVESGVPGRPVGTGLGLALVRRFVELHQGRVWVESEPGSGSTFLVNLPTEPRSEAVV